MKTSARWVLPTAAVALALPALASGGCLADGPCDPSTGGKIAAFAGAVDALVKTANKLKVTVGTSCAAIATDLGQKNVPSVKDPNDPKFDDNLQQACTMAQAAIQLEIDAGATIGVEVIPGQCSIDAKAQFSCEAECSVSGSCDPGSIEVRCEPGELSGQCDAQCQGSCTVTSGTVDCQGQCSGACSGDCGGTCVATGAKGACNGKCNGACNGKCTGTCSIIPPSAKCQGSCKGGCSISYKAPKCEGKLKPPSCDVDADCEAGCNAQAQFKAECSPPQINVVIGGKASVNLKSTLSANLPALFIAGIEQGKDVVLAAGDVADKAVPAAEAALGVAACFFKYGADLASNFGASISASASVSVSIQASASVSAKAGAS